jgi:hypothetical protein
MAFNSSLRFNTIVVGSPVYGTTYKMAKNSNAILEMRTKPDHHIGNVFMPAISYRRERSKAIQFPVQVHNHSISLDSHIKRRNRLAFLSASTVTA